jgi:hypothetical protein
VTTQARTLNDTSGHRAAFLALGMLALSLACAAFPYGAYFGSLALFGLPHVCYELGYARERHAWQAPRSFWLALAPPLAIQAGARLAFWLGAISAPSAMAIDIACLAALGLAGAFAPSGSGYAPRLASLAVAATCCAALALGGVAALLGTLALLHNLTPAAYAWSLARQEPERKAFAARLCMALCLPLAAFAACLAFFPAPMDLEATAFATSASLSPSPWLVKPLFAAIACSQCLHYWSVIVELPRAGLAPWGKKALSKPLAISAWTATAAMLAYWAANASAARGLYAVAAGMHAWIEYPLLALALLGTRHTAPGFAPLAPDASPTAEDSP